MVTRKLDVAVLAAALVILLIDAGSGAWTTPAAEAVLAGRFDRLGAAPLYDLIASAASLLPAGEIGFRLGVLDAVLGALALAGIVAAVRALVPREPAAAVIACVLLLVAAPFREAAAFASPSILAACGTIWAIACALRFARDHAPRDATCAVAACALVVGSAPWLGVAVTAIAIAWLWREGAARELLAGSLGALGAFVVVWWLDALGGLPHMHASLAALASAGTGAAAIVVGAGLLGIAFAAATQLPGARWVAAIALAAAAHEALVGNSATVLVAVLALGAAIVPSAIVRAATPTLEGLRRNAAAFAAGVPLLAAAAATGPTIAIEDPGAGPAQLASDLWTAIPAGPGVFVATRSTSWLALQYEADLAGARADLLLVPPLPSQQADAIVANALRDDAIAGADAAAFGRLDVTRAIPRGRGFQLVGAPPSQRTFAPPPARYPTRIGSEQAALLAIERARHEAASGRLDTAARALGIEARFGAADLAMLAATAPSKERPALFGFLPLDERPPGPWLYDVFGDDLAWVAGLPIPAVDASAPMARRLHAKWREIIAGKAKPDDAAIAAMGPRAVQATQTLFK